MLYKPYRHQQETIDFYVNNNRAFDASTMGTGKTFSAIADIENRLIKDPNSKTVILAPKSLLHSVWANDIRKFAPHITYSIATAPEKKRVEAFNKNANVYITNIDAIKWLEKTFKPSDFKGYNAIFIDESTQFKHLSSRTKSLMKIKKYFNVRRCLSGTPTAGPLTDLFYQYLFLDDGAHFGTSFTRFRNNVQFAQQNGPQPNMVKWVNKDKKEEVIAKLVEDITIRHVLEDVVDMPSRIEYNMKFTPNKKVMTAYNDLKRTAKAQLKTGTISAINAASLTTKLLQTLSGSVYDSEGKAHLVDLQRYDLVLDLVEQTEHSVVFYNWTSQREYLVEQANKRKLRTTFIDGSVSTKDRGKRVDEFQDGKYDTIFLQVKAASHGLTLHKATTSIWTCPTYLADYYIQANARVFRIGQTKRTTTINVEAENTIEERVYEALGNKLSSIETLVNALAD